MYFQRIRYLREQYEYTQGYVANYLKCKRSTYANWETGNIILPLEIASKLAILYNVPLSYILGIKLNYDSTKVKPINYEYMIKKLNLLKQENKHSYEKISRYIDTNRSTTNRYFNNKISIPTDKLVLLCELYNIEIDDLCGTR